jgi:hypothetical protein
MIWPRFVLATAAAAAVIFSAPYVQLAFTTIREVWEEQATAITVGATVVPVAVALGFALLTIRDRRALRYGALASAVALGVSYTRASSLVETEIFHFAEYGLLGWLWYRAQGEVEGRRVEDASLVVVPLLAGTIFGTLDEFFQWFIPIRAGEARDVMLNVVGAGCGLLFAIAVDPPAGLTATLPSDSRTRVVTWAVIACVAFAWFFYTVHVGYDVRDPEIGSFRSRYSAEELTRLARDRAGRWSVQPPVAQRRLSREDQFLTEGLWRVQERDEAFDAGDMARAWGENKILEKFYAPLLDTPTYLSPTGHRWPGEQRVAAAPRPGENRALITSSAYPYPLYVWEGVF